MNNLNNKILTGAIILSLILCVVCYCWNEVFHMSKKHCKNYVIKHRKEFKVDILSHSETLTFHAPYRGFYYTDVTITIHKDNSYQITFWGDRESFFWNFKLDRHIEVDIPHREYKGKNISKDVAIISLFNGCYQ